MINEQKFLADYNAGRHKYEAAELKWWILDHLRQGPSNADVIYDKSQCGDTAMYLALHQLCVDDMIWGLSPYDEESPHTHKEMVYSLQKNGAATFFADAAVEMAKHWNPDAWRK